MAREREDHGVVQLAALDLRRRPDHRAELTSQLLMGEAVRVLQRGPRGEWWRIENLADGYTGWARAYGIRPATRARTRRWLKLAGHHVVVPYCTVRVEPRGGAVLTPLFWNGRVIAGRARAGRRPVELPDGRHGWVAATALATGEARMPLLDRIRDLLGTPYLWGGRTPHGLDCSGLVQQLLAEQGVILPRDAHDQFLATRRALAPDALDLGDLLFFGRGRGRMEHVALVLGGGYYVHARGVVRVNSIDPDNPFYDRALSAQLRAFGRTKLGRIANNRREPKKGEPA
jgi:gamma-D-glutamyl-L-lysine dipeptidyl-peptidase